FFFQAEDGIRDFHVTGVQTCALPICGRYGELPWSHEHYCAGHLIQAAVAQVRATGHDDLLQVAIRLADHLVATFGPGKTEDVDRSEERRVGKEGRSPRSPQPSTQRRQ